METIVKKSDVSLSFAQAKGFIRDTKRDLEDIERAFFKVGFRLNEANEFGYYKELGYTDIYELAEKEFGFRSTTTKNLMEVNRVYSDHLMNTNSLGSTQTRKKYTIWIDPRYSKYSQTQLVEMLPLSKEERANVPTDFKTADLRDYKKSLKSYSGGCVIGYREAIEDPRKAVEAVREVRRKSEIKQTVAQKQDDVPPGQLYIDENENVAEFHQTNESQSTDQSTQSVDLKKMVISQEEFRSKTAALFAEEIPARPPVHNFKNRKQREEFIQDEKNYPVLVLDNDELGITVRRLDFRNGIKVYRTTYAEYVSWMDSTVSKVRYHLIDPDKQRERPQASACCTDYTARCYTLDGTALGYVVDYMTKYAKEI